MHHLFFILYFVFFLPILLFAQGQPYAGPDDPAGDIAAEREGWMTGNRVYLYFQNTTELSYCCGIRYSRWPNDFDGVSMTDGIGLLIGARVYVRDDSIPITDLDEARNEPNAEPVYFLQTSYRERMDVNQAGTIEWGLYPVFGYFDELSEYPAMSNRPESWPQLGWPARGTERKWPGEWNGRFGRGIMYADLETYFVANDAQDQEYHQPSRIEQGLPRYYPRPDVRIGDKKSDVTINPGRPWGGLGIRVSQRGYQWNNPQTRDAIFWEYDITNISDYDINEVAFGYWVDNGIGNNDPDDIAYFDDQLDMCYSWDVDGIGAGGLPTGIMGLAYLESPGLAYDQVDNDNDGLLNERRDNVAVELIGPTEGIHDLQHFMDVYGYTSIDQLKEHWDADEDQDWQDGNDENDNGAYDLIENAGDDVGLDGVGPGELNYTSPDPDGTECNHRPDFIEGQGCEPNFAATDVSESDMVGLTAFKLFPIDHGAFTWFEFDEPMFHLMATQQLEEYIGSLSNLVEIFASGLFPLKQGRTERISMSELHSYEPLSGLNSDEHTAPSLFQKKRIVQFIYESDYRFAQPPKMPTLTATPGDGKVILTWNDVSDKTTREPLLGGINDFEGYKLYKATDKYFADAEKLFDMYGNPIGKKPIYQCDLKNGKRGAADFAHINGEVFYLGEDTGIRHYFVDENVQNGRTYYYGLVAYDYGLDGLEISIMPSENNVVIDLDEAENIRFTGKNVQVVTPHQDAAGYIKPSLDQDMDQQLDGNGIVEPLVFDINAVKANHTYKVMFRADTIGFARRETVVRHPADLMIVNNGLRVYDVTEGGTLVYEETPESYPLDNMLFDGAVRVENGFTLIEDIPYYRNNKTILTDAFDGIQLRMQLPAFAGLLSKEKSGWLRGKANINVQASLHESKAYPYTYDIVFTDTSNTYRSEIFNPRYVMDLNGGVGTSVQPFNVLYRQRFPFYVVNRSVVDSSGENEKLDLLVDDLNNNGKYDLRVDRVLAGHKIDVQVTPTRNYIYWCGTVFGFDFHNLDSTDALPQPDDVYRVVFDRPFTATDSIMFTVTPEVEADEEKLQADMSKIMTVPNPYVMTNRMETAISNANLNQRRKLMFTHIPAQCTIKIFSVGGIFVDEVNVDNAPAQGIVHWDMLTREGLEIAPGIYIYHVKSHVTGEEKLGKFAVIK